MKRLYVSLCCLLSFLSVFSLPQVTRGPYLQQPTPSSIIIKWRTDSATDSKVFYGTDLSALSESRYDGRDTINHTIKINGLPPYTKYYYAVGDSAATLAAADSTQYFVTSPLPDVVQPIRFWAIGDFGKGSDAQRTVRESFLDFTKDHHADLWFWLGDNAYPEGTDEEFQQKVFDSITGYHKIFKNLPFMPTPGNHDYESVCPIICNFDPNYHKGPYFDIIDVPTEGQAGGVPSHTELYYSFDYGNIHFISLNSELGSLFGPYDYNGVFTDGYLSSPVTQWLKADLAACKKTWKIAYWHQLPYSGQDLNSDDFWEFYMHAMRDHFNPILESYGIDLVMCGHDHCYQRTYLINGLYGNSNTFDSSRNIINGTSGVDSLGEAYIKYTTGPMAGKGTVYVVSGNAGAGNPDKPVVHPEMWGGEGCGTCIGSLIVDVNGNRLDGRYVRGDGSIGDHFTILKEIATGIKMNAVRELKAYPNPFRKTFQLEFSAKPSAHYYIDVKDMKGNIVWNQNMISQQGNKQMLAIELPPALPAGAYLVSVNGNNESGSVAIIKQ
jgi:hypothetical protein